jgi:hypothetical protein
MRCDIFVRETRQIDGAAVHKSGAFAIGAANVNRSGIGCR